MSRRVLIASLQVAAAASKGHLNPLVGVCQWLVRSGATVGWLALPHAMGPADRAQVERLGATILPSPPFPAGVIPDGEELARRAMDPARVWEVYRSFLIDPLPHLTVVVRAQILAFAPQVVAADGMCYAGILAAHALCVPWVGIGAGLKILKEGGFAGGYMGELERLVAPRAAAFAHAGYPEPEFRLFECVSPHANIVFTTSDLAGDRPLPRATHLVGPSIPPDARGDETEFDFGELAPGRPVIYVAFGSVHTNLMLDDVNRAIGAAARSIGARLVVSSAALAGRPLPAEFPPDAIVRAYVPQPAVLARADVFVTHGGANSVMEGLYAGVPLLVVPLSSDQPWQARLVVEAGAGEALAREEATPAAVEASLSRLLEPDSPARVRARAIGKSYRKADGARTAAEIIRGLAGPEQNPRRNPDSMHSRSFDALREAVGPAGWQDDETTRRAYQSNVSGLERAIAAVAFPASTNEVVKLVTAAARAGCPLWPIGTGRNWGLGSRLPISDGAVVVDLSRMNRIVSVDPVLGAAVVEAGVTQGQLAQHLHAAKLPLFVNVTGSAPGTSLIANALDRGTGFHMARSEMLAALEVVLGDGRVIQTGLARFSGASQVAGAYRPGVGPELDGLFFQSGFGIVTRATVRLMHRAPAHAILALSMARPHDLARFVDAAAGLARHGILHAALHFSSRARGVSVCGPLVYRYLIEAGCAPDADTLARARTLVARHVRASWSVSCDVSGSKLMVQEALRQARRQLRGIGSAALVTDRQFRALSGGPRSARSERAKDGRAWLAALRASFDHSLGIPSDAALHSIPWALEGAPFVDEPELDRGRAGMFFVVPVIPLSGRAVVSAMEIVDRVSASAGFTPYTTWNQVSWGALEGVINCVFDREDPAAAGRARSWARDLATALAAAGFPPYRLGIQDQELARSGGDYDALVTELGRVLDPAGILAPGRYGA